MKIVIAGKNSIAVEVAKYIMNFYPQHELCVVTNKSDDGKNSFQPSFKKFAQMQMLEIYTLEDLYEIEDMIFLSLEFDRIIKPEKFRTKKLYNIHFSKLPAYKGMYTSALPILHGQSHSAVTLHEIDRGIDTGDIIAQFVFEIDAAETARTLYHKYLNYGTKLIIDHLQSLINNNYQAKQQSAQGSSYYSKATIDYSNVGIELNNTAWNINSQVRAFTFREYQIPTIFGRKMRGTLILNSKSIHKPGTIIEQCEQFIISSTIDYDIKLYIDHYDDLIACCRNDDLEYAQQIIGYVSNLEEKTQQGWTPLMVAAYSNSKRVVGLLLSRGADVNAQNYNGTSVVMYAKDAAIHSHDTEILSLVIQAGAKVTSKDYSNRTVLDYVISQDEEIYEYLKNYDKVFGFTEN